jgi:hypothetical protein
METLGNDAYGLSQINIWLDRFRTGDLSCNDLPSAERPALTFRPQGEAFLQKYAFVNARTIAQHFLTFASIVKEILQRKLERAKACRGGFLIP